MTLLEVWKRLTYWLVLWASFGSPTSDNVASALPLPFSVPREVGEPWSGSLSGTGCLWKRGVRGRLSVSGAHNYLVAVHTKNSTLSQTWATHSFLCPPVPSLSKLPLTPVSTLPPSPCLFILQFFLVNQFCLFEVLRVLSVDFAQASCSLSTQIPPGSPPFWSPSPSLLSCLPSMVKFHNHTYQPMALPLVQCPNQFSS